MTTEYITLDEAAARAGRCRNAIRGWTHAYAPLARKIGGRIEVDAAVLDAILNGAIKLDGIYASTLAARQASVARKAAPRSSQVG
jgi:hypothetical protein